MARSGLAVAVLATAALTVAACGGDDRDAGLTGSSSSPGPSSAAPAPTTWSATPHRTAAVAPTHTTVKPAAEQRCHTGELKADLQFQDVVGEGKVASTLMLTNTSARTCHTFGWVGIGLKDASGGDMPTSTRREAYPGAPVRIELAPGTTAFAGLKWTAGPRCPLTGGMILTPPDETTQLTVHERGFGAAERLRVCDGVVTVGTLQPAGQGVNFTS